jgi:hypothetical protein
MPRLLRLLRDLLSARKATARGCASLPSRVPAGLAMVSPTTGRYRALSMRFPLPCHALATWLVAPRSTTTCQMPNELPDILMAKAFKLAPSTDSTVFLSRRSPQGINN